VSPAAAEPPDEISGGFYLHPFYSRLRLTRSLARLREPKDKVAHGAKGRDLVHCRPRVRRRGFKPARRDKIVTRPPQAQIDGLAQLVI
jgi:hypothetical protein